MKNKSDPVNENELKSYQTLIWQLSWIANQSCRDIAFAICELNSTIKNATINHLIEASKVLKNVINWKVILTFPQMQNVDECSLATYSDSSYNNLNNGGSQGDFLIFLMDKTGRLSPIMWQSKRICQVIKSTMAAETLALVDALEASFWLPKLFIEICSTTEKLVVLPLDCYIDSKPLHEAL